ncbi:MAG: hypothetical protein KJO56_02490 [Gammaproteobacteria bacterium]|nr:hypothetical protein [Gammaproteobacteria bacterium]MBT8105109.1 hypothetical protein [Gammaproteobacteria bacterium]NNF48667.1 hypothetical protein [Woeseiaceae bacterium]NNK25123.1 hypothetical protein [Woeseiaceae bacterium]NNL62328.1 hypothetical protein [Woeseiaceae bacterium]
MFADLPQELILYIAGALLLGWLLGSVSARLNERLRAKRRDPRDDYIRDLEAKLRIALGDSAKSVDEISRLQDELSESAEGLARRDSLINEHLDSLAKTRSDLKESVLKTRELRAELADRATENVHAEAKIREVETELSVAQASTDLLATGALQYAFDEDDETNDPISADVRRTAP